MFPVFLSIATTDGSFNTIPFPFNVTKILAVPKSIPISLGPNLKRFIINFLSCNYCILSSAISENILV